MKTNLSKWPDTQQKICSRMALVAWAIFAVSSISAQEPKMDYEWAKGWSIVRLSIPAKGDLKDAYVDLLTPSARAVTLTAGVMAKEEGVILEKIEWEGAPVRAKITLRKEKERAVLLAGADLISKNEALSRVPPDIEIELKVIDLPSAQAGDLPVPMPPPKPGEQAATVAGVFTAEQAAVFLRGIRKMKGAHVLDGPGVGSRSQKRALFNLSREFHYPIEWDLPAKPGEHWTPKQFGKTDCGLTVDVVPTLLEDDSTLDLNISSELVTFVGFADLETRRPLRTAKPDSEASLLDQAIRSPVDQKDDLGERAQPIFSKRKANASVSIFSGQSVVLIESESADVKPFPAPNADRMTFIIISAHLPAAKDTQP